MIKLSSTIITLDESNWGASVTTSGRPIHSFPCDASLAEGAPVFRGISSQIEGFIPGAQDVEWLTNESTALDQFSNSDKIASSVWVSSRHAILMYEGLVTRILTIEEDGSFSVTSAQSPWSTSTGVPGSMAYIDNQLVFSYTTSWQTADAFVHVWEVSFDVDGVPSLPSRSIANATPIDSSMRSGTSGNLRVHKIGTITFFTTAAYYWTPGSGTDPERKSLLFSGTISASGSIENTAKNFIYNINDDRFQSFNTKLVGNTVQVLMAAQFDDYSRTEMFGNVSTPVLGVQVLRLDIVVDPSAPSTITYGPLLEGLYNGDTSLSPYRHIGVSCAMDPYSLEVDRFFVFWYDNTTAASVVLKFSYYEGDGSSAYTLLSSGEYTMPVGSYFIPSSKVGLVVSEHALHLIGEVSNAGYDRILVTVPLIRETSTLDVGNLSMQTISSDVRNAYNYGNGYSINTFVPSNSTYTEFLELGQKDTSNAGFNRVRIGDLPSNANKFLGIKTNSTGSTTAVVLLGGGLIEHPDAVSLLGGSVSNVYVGPPGTNISSTGEYRIGTLLEGSNILFSNNIVKED